MIYGKPFVRMIDRRNSSAARRVRRFGIPSGRVFPPATGDDKKRIRKTPNRVHASRSHVSREGHDGGEGKGEGYSPEQKQNK